MEFGLGENENRENDLSGLISLIWQDIGIREAVLGKMWANPGEALPTPFSVDLPRVEHRWAAVDCMWQGGGWALSAENLSWLPKDRSTKTPSHVEHRWASGRLHVTRGWAEPCPLRIWADCPRTAPQKLPCVEHRRAVGRLHVTRGWASAASWEFEFFFLKLIF